MSTISMSPVSKSAASVSETAGTTSDTKARLEPTTAAHRRRRHLSVYHRALRSAKTPEQRAAVAARYRKLFAAAGSTEQVLAASADVVDVTDSGLAETIVLPVPQSATVRLAS